MAVIVTGANSGIGFEVAKSLCRQGYDVVISVRDEEKGDSTVSRIKSEFPDAQLTYFTMEMSDPQSIRSFVEEFKDTGKSLHALINNAGVLGSWMDAKRHCVRGDQSIEEMVMVNCMGPFLLTNLLLDLLKQSAAEEKPSLVVNISSRVLDAKVNEWATNLDDIMTEKPESYISGGQVYRWSKVGLNLWSKVLATHLEGTTVKVNCLCPGFIPGTGLFRNSTTSFLWRMFLRISVTVFGRWMFKSTGASDGGELVRKMVTEKEYWMTNGKFYMDGKLHEEPADVLNKANQEAIWSLCEKYTGFQHDP